MIDGGLKARGFDSDCAMREARALLKEKFGYASFRPGQAELACALMSGRDCLGVMPTGAGKSVCYQVPACALRGVAIVVSPLVSLMADQVQALRLAGIAAAYVNSTLPSAEQSEVLRQAARGALDMLYIAPERLDDPRFRAFARHAALSFVAVDEAHCVSQWGQDFRPSYLRIGEFIAALPQRVAVGAFTATATERVRRDIIRLLGLQNPCEVVTGFDRPNLFFGVEQLSAAKKMARIVDYANGHASESGIVYCSTRKEVERVCTRLNDKGVRATRYHAGLSVEERERNQRAFVDDARPVMVATNAFGMGIDKSNVRYVVHHNMPASLEAYYQEAGRAGRDGEPADCLLLWNDGDIGTCRYFIEGDMGNEVLDAQEASEVRAAKRRLLGAMVGYCMTSECLRAYILRYFGERERQASVRDALLGAQAVSEQGASGCARCSNCTGAVDTVDVTRTARSVMRCVHELRGRFGKGVVADVVTGSKSAKLRELGLSTARTFGDAAGARASTVKQIIELLAAEGYLDVTEGRFSLVGLGPRMREAASDGFSLSMKSTSAGLSTGRGQRAQRACETGQLPAECDDQGRSVLFDRLRGVRTRLASEASVPPYVVFSDAALREMCSKRPHTSEEFLAIGGVGPVKLARYGEAFLSEIADFERA